MIDGMATIASKVNINNDSNIRKIYPKIGAFEQVLVSF